MSIKSEMQVITFELLLFIIRLQIKMNNFYAFHVPGISNLLFIYRKTVRTFYCICDIGGAEMSLKQIQTFQFGACQSV